MRLILDAEDIRNYYYPLGFANHEIVALFGNRTLGFLKNKDFAKEDRWSRNPYIFDNNYFQELLDNKSPFLKTDSDLALVNDKDFVKWVEVYANDQNLFFEYFASSYRKMSEIGYNNLQYEL
jgi:catalase (peroxidase I)